MKDLNKKALAGLLQLFIILAALLFITAWTINYWQAWLFLFVFFTSSLMITIYLIRKDPKLLERRVKGGPSSEKEKSQKIIQIFSAIAFITVIALPAIDHRLEWSAVPTYTVVAGDILIAIGFYFVFLVFRENTFTSAIIEISAEQVVISTGPYALVRHPMYAGALILLSGIPLALGSWWDLLTLIPFTFALVWRLLDEERFLLQNLQGYSDYQKKVKYRLVPFIW
jgi:protein-S-isoprenylcysteine O-methyltransferase Ste14